MVRGQRDEKHGVAEAIHGAGQAGDGRRIAQRRADQRQDVVEAERAVEAAVRVAEQADEQGFEARLDEGMRAEYDAAAPRIESSELGDGESERENRILWQRFGGSAEVGVQVSDD